MFIIDGSKALWAAINAVFGADQPVQRCRAHKLRNVLDHLPEEQKEQVKSLMRAAWKMEWKAGMARILNSTLFILGLLLIRGIVEYKPQLPFDR